MKSMPYLHFDGRCEEAFKFYEQSLGARIDGLFRYEGSPAAAMVPPGQSSNILHASLTIGDTVIMGADAPPGHYLKPQGFSITLAMEDTAEAERVFNALAAGGSVTMPLAPTFWARSFGMLVDRFGIPWMINCGTAE